MSTRTVNLTLLMLMTLELASGTLSLLVGTPNGRWLFWLHRIGGLAILGLLYWKLRVVVSSYRKRGLALSTSTSALFGVLVVGTLVSGVLWATTGFPGTRLPLIGSLTGLGVHIALSVALIPFLIWHSAARWPLVRGRMADFTTRRAALRYGALTAAGLASWQGLERITRAAELDGLRRRYSGSRETGSFTGNAFPSTNWFTDPRPRIEPDAWRCRMHGAVRREMSVRLADLASLPSSTVRATLDCTGGWYTTQDWSGVPLSALLDTATPRDGARSLVVRSATGYTRRFPVSEAAKLLLAIHVGGEALSRGHGAPVRLVAPGYRGFHWVKWVVDIEVSELPEWWQSPLPLQ